MIFHKAYVANSICAPSRATLLTGKHSHLNGKIDNRGKFDHNQNQFQKVLQKKGYQTAMIGKIHLDGKMQGFDYWEVLPGQGSYNNPIFISQKGKETYQGHSTDIITNRALNFLSKRNLHKPFILMVHFKAPHRNWLPALRFKEKFKDVIFPEPPSLFDNYSTRTTAAYKQKMTIAKDLILGYDLKADKGQRYKFLQENKLSAKEFVRWKYQTYMRDYFACIAGIDENIGRLMKYLNENNLDKNTIVMYSSDQGFFLGEHGWFDKRFMYEESFRTPFIVRWKKEVKPNTHNFDLVQNIDFAPTFLDMAKAPIPQDMQGESLVALMKGKTPTNWRKSLYYHYYEYPGSHSVRKHEGVATKRYKLIRFYGKDVPNNQEWEFYDLENDPQELHNLYPHLQNTPLITKIKQEIKRLRVFYKVR